MKAITELADRLGMSHLQVAGLLGMGKSHFYLAMQGQRDWPAPALERLAQWLQHCQQQAAPAPDVLTAAELKACRQWLANLTYKEALARRAADRLQRRRAALLAQQAVLSSYLHSPAALPPKERKYTELQLSQCRLRLNRCSPVQVLQANLKLAAATEQLRLLRQHLAAYEVEE